MTPVVGEVSWKRNIAFLWLSQILSMASFAAVMPFIPIYFRDHFGLVDEGVRGAWVAGFNFAGQLAICIIAPVWGMLADRFGRKLMLLRANYVSALLLPCMALAPNAATLVFLRFAISLFSGTVTAAQTLAVTTTPEKHQGFALGALSTAFWSGHMLGYLAGGFLVHSFGFGWTFVGCGFLFLAAGALVQLFVRENFVRPAAPPPTAETAKKRGFRLPEVFSYGVLLILLLFALMGLARRFDGAYIAMLVEKVHGLEDTAYYTGWISAAAAIGGIFSGLLIGKLCDRFSPVKIALPSVLIAVFTMLAQAFAPTLLVLGTARFFNFLAAGGLEPAFLAMLSRSAPPEKRGTLLGLASSIRMAGILLSTVASGLTITLFGTRSVFIAGAGIFLLLLPILYLAGRKQSAKKG